MRTHLEHVFGGDLDGHHDGWIELRMLKGARDDPDRGSQSHWFHTDELDELADRALEINRQPGWNAFFGQALLQTDGAPFGAASDSDYLASPCAYVDLDKAKAVTGAKDVCERQGMPPTAWVITGRYPERRAQLWWRLAEPITDPEQHRRTMRGLAALLNGDMAVTNPTRILRLGGSLAWPIKNGRVLEQTEFRVRSNGLLGAPP